MKIYLDSCSLQRPLDTKDQLRIVIEAEAILSILTVCESHIIKLVSSEALIFETQKIPHLSRKQYITDILKKAEMFIQVNEKIEYRAREFIDIGIKPLDALHLASAEDAHVDYFCTCDDRFYKKATLLKNLKFKIVSPIELIKEIE